jgi:hypothetical protein
MVQKIGFLSAHPDHAETVRQLVLRQPLPAKSTPATAFANGLKRNGYVVDPTDPNHNLELEALSGQRIFSMDEIKNAADDLIGAGVELVFAADSLATICAYEHTVAIQRPDIPIVMALTGNPPEIGLADSLERPGKNVTGLTDLSWERGWTRLDLLIDMIDENDPTSRPEIVIVANVHHPGVVKPGSAGENGQRRWIRNRAESEHGGRPRFKYVQLRHRDNKDLAMVRDELRRELLGANGAIVCADPLVNLYRLSILACIRQNFPQLPVAFHQGDFVQLCEERRPDEDTYNEDPELNGLIAGGLLSYGADRFELIDRAVDYVRAILDIPVDRRQQEVACMPIRVMPATTWINDQWLARNSWRIPGKWRSTVEYETFRCP